MRKHSVKSNMFFLMMVMSIIIFAFAFSASNAGTAAQEKDLPFYSDHYFVCDAEDMEVTITEFAEIADADLCLQVSFINEDGSYRFLKLTQEFFAYLGLEYQDYGKENVAFVNSLYRSQCYQEQGRWKINIKGDTYLVGAFFENQPEDGVVCYINADSANADTYTQYSLVAVDPLPGKADSIKKHIAGRYPDMKISDWNGRKNGAVYLTDTYAQVGLLCGIVLCVNGIGFANMWVGSYRRELSVRKLVGANASANHRFLLREYLKLFSVAMAAGIIILQLIFLVIRKCEALSYVRNIFGAKISFAIFLWASLAVLSITLAVLEFTYVYLNKKSIAVEVKG